MRLFLFTLVSVISFAGLPLKAHDPSRDTTPPTPIKQVSPEYPPDMAQNGIRGEVVLRMLIDITGHVEKASVVRSNNPAFDKAAIEAALASQYKPATRDGVPVSVTVQQPFIFEVFGMPGGGADAFSLKKSARSKHSPEHRNEIAAKISGVARAVYPYELLRTKQKGKATVRMQMDTLGQVSNVTLVEANAPEFGFAAMAAAEHFSLIPSTNAGSPVQSILQVEVTFDSSIPNPGLMEVNHRLHKLEMKGSTRIVNGLLLDRPLKIVSQKAAIFPKSTELKAAAGRAVIEFLIDEKGNVALPRIISADAPEFGYAAVQAVSGWLFEPPTSKGKKAIAKARIPFEFKSSGSRMAVEPIE
jgi:TonB family protein